MRTFRLGTRIVIVALILLLAAPFAVTAQRRDGVGVGVMLGEPTGLAAVWWLGGNNAVDLVAAWSFRGNGSIYLHADYQFHGYVERPLTVYAGLGGFVLFRDDPAMGLRIPIGVTFLFEQAPLDIFLEVAPGMALIPATDFVVGGGLGFRFYF